MGCHGNHIFSHSPCSFLREYCFTFSGPHWTIWHPWEVLPSLSNFMLKKGYIMLGIASIFISFPQLIIGPRSAVGNVSGYRCVSDCRFRGHEFDPGPVPYFLGDWSWNDFYGLSPPFCWFIQEGLLSFTSESMCTNYWLTVCSSLPRKKCG